VSYALAAGRFVGTLVLGGIFLLLAVPTYLISGIIGSAVVVYKSIFDSPWG
jgi:hypothetical protein